MGYNTSQVAQSAQIAVDGGTGDLWTFAPMIPIIVSRWGYMVSTTTTGTPDFALDLRLAIGDDTGRIADWGGTITTVAGLAPGVGCQHTIGKTADGTQEGVFASGDSRPAGMVIPGEELVFQMPAGASQGDGFAFIEYEPLAGQGMYVLVTELGVFTEYAA